MSKIIVASCNPVKLNSAFEGFRKMFPQEEFEIEGVGAPSGVSDQPMSDREAFQGALGRVRNASIQKKEADYWVGIEGGIQECDGQMEVFAWVVIKSRNGKIGKGRTGAFCLPGKIAELIKQGKELGEADDIVFGRTNSKQKNGAIGILTDDAVDRTKYYTEAVIFASIPFKNEALYT